MTTVESQATQVVSDFERQVRYDRLHHQMRVVDLSQLTAKCSFHRELLRQSIEVIQNGHFPINSVDLEDNEYLQMLDAFEAERVWVKYETDKGKNNID